MEASELAIPTLPSRAMNDTLVFYQTLGFEAEILGQGDAYAILTRGALEPHTFLYADLDPYQSSFACYLRVQDAATHSQA